MVLIVESKNFTAPTSNSTSSVSLDSSVWGSEAPKTHLLVGVSTSSVAETIRPNGNANTLWDVYAYTLIDDVVNSPSSAGDGTNVEADRNDEEEEQQWDFEALSALTSASSVEVFVRHVGDGVDGDAVVNVKIGGVWQTGQTISYSGTYSWVSGTWSGSWSASDFDDFEIGITSPDDIGHGREYKVAVAYAVVTGTAASPPVVGTHMQNSIGWSDGTDNVAIGAGSANGKSAYSISNRTHRSAFTTYPLSENGGTYESAVQSSYSAAEINHTWSNSSTEGLDYFLLALGGSDVENISIDVITTPTSIGDVSYTGPGFEPDFLIVFTSAAYSSYPIDTVQPHQVLGFGFSDGNTDAASYSASLDTRATSETYSVHSSELLHIISSAAGHPDLVKARVKSFDSVGYTLTYSAVYTVGYYYSVVAIKGPKATVVSALQAASNTTSDVSTVKYTAGTTTVKPNADGTGATNFWLYLGGSLSAAKNSAGDRFSAINNGIASPGPDDTDYILGVGQQGTNTSSNPITGLFGFENMPADFERATSITLKIRDRCGTTDPTACGTFLQIFKADGSTPLTEKLTKTNKLGDISTSFADKTYPFTLITGSTDKTSWDGAVLKISVWEDDSEDGEYFVSEAQLELSYITTTVLSAGFVPKAGICFGSMKTDSHGVGSDHNRFTIGAWDAQNNMDAGGWIDENNVTTTDTDRYQSNAYSIVNYNHAQGVVGQAAVAALPDNGNGIREAWSSTDGTKYAHSWLLLGDTEAAGGGGGGESSSIVPVTNALLRPSLVGV